MNRTSSYNELFDRYWQWLLERFRNEIRVEYSPREVSPGKGNTRRVEYVDEKIMLLRETKETTSRIHQSKCLRTELRDDFWKLYQDPEVDNKLLPVLRKQYQIKNLVEFKRHMFKEFREFASNPPDSQPAITNMATRKSARTNVFISYSHKDKKWRELFQASLKPLIRANQFSVWDDTQIKAGDDWRDEIKKALSSAKVAVLLVSMNFCNSDFIAENELPPLLEAAQSEGLKIHLIIVGHSLFDETELGRYQAVNDPSKPLAAMTAASREREIVRICREIKAAVTSPPAVKPSINIEEATSGRPTDQPESITVYPASAHLRNLGS